MNFNRFFVAILSFLFSTYNDCQQKEVFFGLLATRLSLFLQRTTVKTYGNCRSPSVLFTAKEKFQ